MNTIFPSTHTIRLYIALFSLSTLISGFAFLSNAMAQEEASKFIDILPTITSAEDPNAPLPGQTTHDAIRLTPDKSEIIKLDTDASSIIVGNAAHLSILADTPTTLVLVPKIAGATHFSVLDKRGNLIMQRHVLVAAPTTDYIRVKKTCSGENEDCIATSVYYCPDTCHEILSQGSEETTTSAPETTE